MLKRRLVLATIALAVALPAAAVARTSRTGPRVLKGYLSDPNGDTVIQVGRKSYEVQGTLQNLLFTVANDSFARGESRKVTLFGNVTRGSFGMSQVDAQWVQAKATQDLVVRVYSSDSSALSITFMISNGDRFRISELTQGYYHVAPMTGSLDTYAYVDAAQGIEIGEVSASTSGGTGLSGALERGWLAGCVIRLWRQDHPCLECWFRHCIDRAAA